MAKSAQGASGKARTAPKGRATAPRGATSGRRSILTPRIEWALAILVFLIVLALIFYFLGDVRSTQGGTTGSPAEVVRAPVSEVPWSLTAS